MIQRWGIGDQAWFEYHCNESPDSPDAPAWYRSHQRVVILSLQENDGAGLTREERAEWGQPYTYTVRFPDGLEWCVFEDEISETQAEWERPDPPEQLTLTVAR